MTRSLFSPSWHSVANLRPTVHPHARISRHVYQGKVWFILQEESGGRYYRFTPLVHRFISMLNGQQTIDDVWTTLNSEQTDLLTQGEVVDVLIHLHKADLLIADMPPDAKALFERHRKKKWKKLKEWFLNPMSLKLPLFNPDRFIQACAPYFTWLTQPIGAVLWLLTVLPALFLAMQHWGEISNNLSDRVLSSSNLLVLFLVYPVIKAIHEFGHGIFTKLWGGAVPQTGLMFLVFAPVPYVDVSSSIAFPSKWKRALVAAAGILSEIWIAALAVYVWLSTQPGIVHTIAYNAIIIAGVSSLLINGNPLLRYDAYYVLCDLLEIPNLAQRAQAHWARWMDKHLFKASNLAPNTDTRFEQICFTLYAPVSWVYRAMITVVIMLFVGQSFFIFGALIALWGAFTFFVKPIIAFVRHIQRSQVAHSYQSPAWRKISAALIVLAALVFIVPLPVWTNATGVVWLPDQAIVRASQNGHLERWFTQAGQPVKTGEALFVLDNPDIEKNYQLQQARVDEAQAKWMAQQYTNLSQADGLKRQLEQEQNILKQHIDKRKSLLVRAELGGQLIVDKARDKQNQFFKKGELIGYVFDPQNFLLRVVITQSDVGLFTEKPPTVRVKISGLLDQRYSTHIIRVFPGGTDELPSPALSTVHGGSIPTSPNDEKSTKSIERVFVVDLHLPPELQHNFYMGQRVYVKFDHGGETLFQQIYRRIRQLFLSHFNV